MFSPRLPGPVVETSLGVKELHLERWKAVLRPEGTQKKWDMYEDFMFFMGNQ